MSNNISFKGWSIISCGTLRAEIDALDKEGFLNTDKILYTAPGLHEKPQELERQLKRLINNAKQYSRRFIVVYGNRCYIDLKDPSRDIDKLIQEEGVDVIRIQAKNCIDMLVSEDERAEISKGKKVYWFSPGWLKYRELIFKDWDQGKANENFPQHDKAILLDALDFFDEYSRQHAEKILEFADWMRINIEPHRISLDRLKGLLIDAIS